MVTASNESSQKYCIRAAALSDMDGILAVKESLAIQRNITTTREGFLLGSSPDFYGEMISGGIARVIEDPDSGSITGIGFALPWDMLQRHEVWQKRTAVAWTRPILNDLEQGRPGYLDQLAVIPGTSVRFMAPGLALALIETLFETGHTHMLATTVLKPVRNQAALKLLGLVQAEVVGEIEETYEGVGAISSQVHCVTEADYRRLRSSSSWKSRVLAYLEKTASKRGGWVHD